MSRFTRFLTFCVLAALVSVGSSACGGDDDPVLVTTTSRVVTTAASTTTAPDIETTTTTAATTGEAAETTDGAEPDPEPDPMEEIEYDIVRREPSRDGELFYVEIPPGSYTDVDLENLVLSVYEEWEDLYEVHVFDNGDAVEVLVKAEEERTSEEAELLDRHYLVSLLEGTVLRFQGPFADLEGFIIGS